MEMLWYLRHWWSSLFNYDRTNYHIHERLSVLELKVNDILNYICLQKQLNLKLDSSSSYSSSEEEDANSAASSVNYDSDGSNLAIYSKPSINDTTRLQYVTGHRDEFETRKRMYDGVTMDKLYEAHNVNEPAYKISKLEKDITNAGVKCEYAGQNGIVVYANQETVKRLIQEHL
uniref:38.7 k n=1 Tax=Spodoptera frugiperda granulovirus TaxID=307454 RepID=A0A346QVY9_9BBAC|nr:38.7 k [Spodoptera frugiperda granulovirus]